MKKSPNFDNEFGFATIFANNMLIFERIEEKWQKKQYISGNK
jgi:hypothetical protein